MSGSIVNFEGEVRVATCNLGVGKRSRGSGDVIDEPRLDVVADAMRKSHDTKTSGIVPIWP